MESKHQVTQLVVIGAGPGGYAAAFRAADLGLQVSLIDLEPQPGGVCLYRGCIPSKALLHAAKLIFDSQQSSEIGIKFAPPEIHLDQLRGWKDQVVQKLTGGLADLCKMRKVTFLQGRASFFDSDTLIVHTSQGETHYLKFEKVILATGSRPVMPADLYLESPHLLNSTTALDLPEIPKTMLVIGGGYIGLELGTVYAALGTQVTLVEMAPSLLPGVDRDLVRILAKRVESLFHKIYLNTRVSRIHEEGQGLSVVFETVTPLNRPPPQPSPTGGEGGIFDKVLIAIGRRPNSSGLGLQNTSVELDEKGFVKVNAQRQTADPRIYAIGDLAGEPMLAHKATHEGGIAAEAMAGHSVAYEPQAIPAVIFTDPEIAWCGLTESEARSQKREVKISRFPWIASGRALTLNRPEGVTKIIADPTSGRILGVGICGAGAGELIAEGVLAIEMGATAADLSLSIHPHPTLSETLKEAAEGVEGSSLHLYRPGKEGRS